MPKNSLTQVGMRHHYLIGREIRKKYVGISKEFIIYRPGKTFNPLF